MYFLWDKHVYPHCSVAYAETCINFEGKIGIAVFLVGVGIVWYIVGLEIESIGQDKRALVPSSTSLRVGADAVLLSVAGILCLYGRFELAKPSGDVCAITRLGHSLLSRVGGGDCDRLWTRSFSLCCPEPLMLGWPLLGHV